MAEIDARVDPNAAIAAANDLLAQAHGESEAPTEAPKPPPLPETVVHLPAGYLGFDGLAETAEVRELTGEDEEIILRVEGNLAKTLDTILSRGVVAVGEAKADKAVLDGLLAGDRDMLLLGIRRATFGDDLHLRDVRCPHCSESQEVHVSLSRDVPVKALDDSSERSFTLTLASGREVSVGLPNGAAQRELALNINESGGVLNTILLKHCVQFINGIPTMGSDSVRKNLSWRDREEILAEINKRNPGPRLSEVSRPCTSCSEEIPLPLVLVDLFRFR